MDLLYLLVEWGVSAACALVHDDKRERERERECYFVATRGQCAVDLLYLLVEWGVSAACALVHDDKSSPLSSHVMGSEKTDRYALGNRGKIISDKTRA